MTYETLRDLVMRAKHVTREQFLGIPHGFAGGAPDLHRELERAWVALARQIGPGQTEVGQAVTGPRVEPPDIPDAEVIARLPELLRRVAVRMPPDLGAELEVAVAQLTREAHA